MSSSVVFDLERKNVILAKKVVLESDKLRKLEQKIEEVTVCEGGGRREARKATRPLWGRACGGAGLTAPWSCFLLQ